MNDWLLGHQWILWLLVIYSAANTWALEQNIQRLHDLTVLIWERVSGRT